MNYLAINDEQFLQTILAAVKLLSDAMPAQMLGIKDLNSLNLYCSNSFAQALNVPEADVTGKIFCTGHILDIVISEDQQVFASRKLHAFLKINKFHDTIKPLIFIKTPLINPDTHNVVGLLLQVFEYGVTNSFQQQIGNLYKMFTTKQVKTIKLSKREKQVVFFFLAHLSSQDIADMLYQLENKRISKSTIDSIFTDQLYLKFNVVNRSALYKKLLELGYDKFIPQEILTNSSIPLEMIRVY